MAAINITSGNSDTNTIVQGARVVVRNSSGTPYVIIENSTDDSIDVWKGNSTTPTSFSEQDNGNNPSATVYGSCSAAIDSGNIIHIAYQRDNGKDSELRYVTFNADGTTDTFSGDVAVVSDIGADPTSITNLRTGISVDSSDVPHIVFMEFQTNMGTSYFTTTYVNRVGGSFNSTVEVEGQATERDTKGFDITISDENVPEISTLEDDTFGLFATRAFLGNANDTTSFSKSTIALSSGSSGHDTTSIVVDSSGNTYVATSPLSNVSKHDDGENWNTWNTDIAPGHNGLRVTLVADGTDIYMFYEDPDNNDIRYNKYTGSWQGEITLEVGTYNSVKSKWAFSVDFDSTGTDRGGGGSRAEIDYVFTDETGSADIFFNILLQDLVVDDTPSATMNRYVTARTLVWTDKNTGYAFFKASDGTFHYRKTTDGGSTWPTEVSITSNSISTFAIWYDKWTKGDTNSIIHMAFVDIIVDDIVYNSFDTADDTLDGEVVVLAGDTASTVSWLTQCISITKSKNGTIFVGGWMDNGGENGFWKGNASPATSFDSKTTLADGNSVDRIMFLPGNETDKEDIWCLYQDVSADQITLKIFDDSANTWSESSVIDTLVSSTTIFQFDCMERHSDTHVILVLWNEHAASTADLAVWDLTDSSTFTAKADIRTNLTTNAVCGLLINQQNDDLYVVYPSATSNGIVKYKLSTDDAGSWGTETDFSIALLNVQVVGGGTSVDNAGGKWMPYFFTLDVTDILTNADNSISIDAVTVTAAFHPDHLIAYSL